LRHLGVLKAMLVMRLNSKIKMLLKFVTHFRCFAKAFDFVFGILIAKE